MQIFATKMGANEALNMLQHIICHSKLKNYLALWNKEKLGI